MTAALRRGALLAASAAALLAGVAAAYTTGGTGSVGQTAAVQWDAPQVQASWGFGVGGLAGANGRLVPVAAVLADWGDGTPPEAMERQDGDPGGPYWIGYHRVPAAGMWYPLHLVAQDAQGQTVAELRTSQRSWVRFTEEDIPADQRGRTSF